MKSPERIISATSSLRKALLLGFMFKGNPDLLLQWQALNYARLSLVPSDFHALLEEQIPNGDNVLAEGDRLRLGKMGGIPLEAHAQRGENQHTVTAAVEARNKRDDVAVQHVGEPVVVFSSDVISENPKSPDAKLGKPYKHEQFPGFSSPYLKEFEEWYLTTYYPPGTVVDHIHAISARHMKTGEELEQQFVIRQTVPQQIVEIVKHFHYYSGGAGVAQQLIRWQANILDEIDDTFMRRELAAYEKHRRQELLYAHIIGVPAWVLPHVVEQLSPS